MDAFRHIPGVRLTSLPFREGGFEVARKWKPSLAIAHIQHEKQAELIQSLGIPVINTSGVRDEFLFPTVTLDNHATGRMAAEHLLGKNLKAFAYMGSSEVRHSRERLEGFSAAVKEAGGGEVVTWNRSIRGLGVDDPESHLPLAHELLDWVRSQPPGLGVFCMDDYVAQAFLDHLALAVENPLERIAVISGHHGRMPTFPSVSGVMQSTEKWGSEVARVTMLLLKGRAKIPQLTRIPPAGVLPMETTAGHFQEDPDVHSAILFIHRMVHEGINVHDVIASLPGVHRRTLERRFSESVGHGILEEIQSARVERARLLLADSEHSLATISDQCGFSSVRHFHRVFMDREGVTPTAFRKQRSVHAQGAVI
ncbi:MAG: helix-turn-helix domain-containing protein [Verrucomicrobia bacterium]|nr:helix-turn-helix domain-containing protein [Verrucomicrobiota bacterium]MCH8512582.1 helix-turn-helix domain-containing protein [Kiritimatiellia bacterium]